MIAEQALHTIKRIIKQGGIIAYPTEAVYGLSCDPFNEQAVQRLLHIKQRSINKGLILLIAGWEQVPSLVTLPSQNLLQQVKETWPGPVTWLFPINPDLPEWISGGQDRIALRMTNHPIAQAICVSLSQPLVSTSANMSGQAPLRTYEAVQQSFGESLDYIVPGATGGLAKPTIIRDVLTGRIVRG